MGVRYVRLWKLLLDKKLKRTDLKSIAQISSSTLAKLGKDEYVSLESLDKICEALDCQIQDVMEFEHSSKETYRKSEGVKANESV